MKNLILITFILFSYKSIAQKKYSNTSDKDLGIGMTIGGATLTTALLLESQSTYGTYSPNPNNNNTNSQTYTIPPLYKQFPKNVFIVIGVSFTVIGLFNLK